MIEVVSEWAGLFDVVNDVWSKVDELGESIKAQLLLFFEADPFVVASVKVVHRGLKVILDFRDEFLAFLKLPLDMDVDKAINISFNKVLGLQDGHADVVSLFFGVTFWFPFVE